MYEPTPINRYLERIVYHKNVFRIFFSLLARKVEIMGSFKYWKNNEQTSLRIQKDY